MKVTGITFYKAVPKRKNISYQFLKNSANLGIHHCMTNTISFAAANAIKNSMLASVKFRNNKQEKNADDTNAILAQEYGINSSLTNPDVANLFLESAEDFVKLNDKNIFNGLKLSDGEGFDNNWYDPVDCAYEKDFEIEFSNKHNEKEIEEKTKANYDNGKICSDNKKYMFYMLLGRFLCFKQNPDTYMNNSKKDYEFDTKNQKFLSSAKKLGLDALEDWSAYTANYIAAKMCNFPTTKTMDDVYELFGGPFVNLPENKSVKPPFSAIHSFHSLKEAHDYLKQYGIKASFPTLKLANLTVEAIEDFIKINNNKNLFKGLQLVYETADEFWLGSTNSGLKEGVVSVNLANVDWKNIDRVEKREQDRNWHSTDNPKGIIYHELGHWLHNNNNKNAYKTLREDYKIFKTKKLSQNTKNIFGRVSSYSVTNPLEFVAEYIAGRMSGYTYPKAVNDLFEKYYNYTGDTKEKSKIKFKLPLKFPEAKL